MIRHVLFYFIASATIAGQEVDIAGNCTDDDMHIFNSNAEFTQTFRSCARRHMAEAQKTSLCITEYYPALHSECANCFGAFAACAKKHCWSSCFVNSESKECIDCGLHHCGDEWEHCSGRSISLFPQKLF